MCLCVRMLVLEWKERAFIGKVNSGCFCWFPAAILVHQNGAPVWRLHTKLYKGAWNVSANNSETVGHKDLRLGPIVYIIVFYNISFSWLLPLDGFQFNFLLRDSENDLYVDIDECSIGSHDCHQNATCINTPEHFNCSCLPGFTRDGHQCYGMTHF